MSENFRHNNSWAYGLIFILSWMLMGCDHVKQGLGLDRHQADEFNVIERPPLTMPPRLTLSPPVSERHAVKSKSSRTMIQNFVVKPPASAHLSTSKAEQNLLTNLQTQRTNKEISANGADIRDIVDQESEIQSKREPGLAEGLVFWKDPRPQENEDVIDPKVEKKKLEPMLSTTSKDTD